MAGKRRNKDHLRSHASAELVVQTSPPFHKDEPLRWWTQHATEATKVDLHEFHDGRLAGPRQNAGWSLRWTTPFTGRPTLIKELAPHLKAKLRMLGADTAEQYIGCLRGWWRLFDSLEMEALPGSGELRRVVSVADLNALHEAAAHEKGISPKSFCRFRELANLARASLGLPALRWFTPETQEPERQLITDEMARVLRIALKTNWRAVRREWAFRDQIRAEAERRADVTQRLRNIDQLVSSSKALAKPPYRDESTTYLGAEGNRLMANWLEYKRISDATGTPIPTSEELRGNKSSAWLCKRGLSKSEMFSMLFPTAWDVEAAFHMALMDSGWNPSTLRNVDATDPHCVAPSLKDHDRYLVLRAAENDDQDQDHLAIEISMCAPKPRSRDKLQTCYGLAKNTCSAPSVVLSVIERTRPLRAVLMKQLDDAIAKHAELSRKADTSNEDLAAIFLRIQRLRRGVKSVWLYLTRTGKIWWLDKDDNHRRFDTNSPQSKSGLSYLGKVIEQLAATEKKVGKVTPGDFRDLFARSVYHESGGSIVAVMLALGHSSTKTSIRYLDNTLSKSESNQAARSFLDSLFGQLSEGRLDITILAQLCRHGPLTPEMNGRLLEYRSLMHSRLGVGCSDPMNPPTLLEPEHQEGRLCGGQRCALCPNARFLPESLDGFAMRAEELNFISDQVPREAWLRSNFGDELRNIEALLKGVYPTDEVAAARFKWRERIATRAHRIPGHPALLIHRSLNS